MVQLNLLPDVKLEYIKTKRTKRLVILGSLVVIVVSIGLFTAMFSYVKIAQKQHMKHLDNDIDSGISTIQNTPEIDKILTVQNQLTVINGQHDQKAAVTRALPYIAQLLPAGSKVNQFDVDITGQTMSLTGITPDIVNTNKLVDTLKFAQYKTKSGLNGSPFSDVVLTSYGAESGKESSFAISMKFDPVIFKNTEEVSITVPGIVSTRSSTEKPNIQFDAKTKAPQGGGN